MNSIANEQEEKQKDLMSSKSNTIELAEGIMKALAMLPKPQRKKIEMEIQNQLSIEKKTMTVLQVQLDETKKNDGERSFGFNQNERCIRN